MFMDFSPNTPSAFMDELLLSISSSRQAVIQVEGRTGFGNPANNPMEKLQNVLNTKMEVLKRMLQQHPELQFKCQTKMMYEK